MAKRLSVVTGSLTYFCGGCDWVYCIVSAAMVRSLRGAHSSAEERYVDIVEVIGSIPIAPTKKTKNR